MRSTTRTRRLGTAAVAAGSLVAASVAALPASAAPRGCDARPNNTIDKLLECVELDGVVEHMQALQDISDENGGNRADASPGYLASVDYVVEALEDAGWSAEVVPFTYDAAEVALEQLTPTAATFPAFDAVGTGEGDVSTAVVPVDVVLTGDRVNSSGCEAADFAGFPAGSIALIQRGTCAFSVKAENAALAGAAAVVLFNQGDTIGAGDRFGPVSPTLAPLVLDIPVVGTSFAAGESLAVAGSTATVTVDFFEVTSANVVAELPGRNDSNVVMAGAHLDSVPVGPGTSDNSTGAAALLEVAEQMSRVRPQNTVRLAWWGAEELGLIGSNQWVAQRTPEELDEIALYLNFDMVGSANYFFGVYDADQSSFEAPVVVPEGSVAIEDTFESFYTLRGEPYDDTDFSGRSDYQAFINNGIPSGGLFTGAEEVKTPAQAELWGGTAGAQFDPCYHQACDTILNYDARALEVNADAIAFAVLRYSASTETVNGVDGRSVPGRFLVPAPAGPEFTFVEPNGGGADGDDEAQVAR